jgi:hypothetical protein
MPAPGSSVPCCGVDFPLTRGQFPAVPPRRLLSVFACLVLLAAACLAAEKKRYILYATFLSDTPVELSDGARWMMDRGDSFPIAMFKEQQTIVVLQFAGTQFSTEASRVKITPGEEVTPEMVANYRRNVQGYVDGKSEKILAELKPAKKAEPVKKKTASRQPAPGFKP